MKWINNQGVKSSKGYSLQREDRFHYIYTEDDDEIILAAETSPNCVDIKLNDLVWKKRSRTLSEGELHRIKENLREALVFMGRKKIIFH